MKKIIALLLALTLVFSCGLLMTSCGGGDCTDHVDADDNGMCDKCDASMIPTPPANIDVVFNVKDQDGIAVGGITVTLTESGSLNGEGSVSAVSGTDGKFTLNIKPGTYLISADYDVDAIGFFALSTTRTVIESKTSSVDILMENKTPNGTESRPYNLSVGENSLTVPAGESVHYILYRAMNLMANVTAENIKIEYAGVEYTPDQDGKISFPFLGADLTSVANVKITSTGSLDATVDFKIEAFPGTIGNPYTIESLGDITQNDVTKGEAVYYTYTATVDGTLTLNVTSANTHAAMQNNFYQVSTSSESSMTISLTVAVGDEVMIDLTTSADENPVISFTLSVE